MVAPCAWEHWVALQLCAGRTFEMGISIKNQKNVENVALNMRSVQKVSSYVI